MNKSFFKIGLIYFIAMTLLAIVFCLGYWGIVQDDIFSSFLIQIVVMLAVPMLLYTVLISKNKKQTLKDAGFKKISKKMLVISIFIGIVLFILNQFVANIFASIISILGYETISSPTQIELTYEFLIKELILTCILPSICEEFIHRGLVLNANKTTGNPKYCLIISSILFGLTHLNINQFFYAAILGYLMGYTCLVADSIYPAMIAHFINNFLGSFIYYGMLAKLPICTLFYAIEALIYSNFITLFLTILIGIPLLIGTYKLLIKKLLIERTKRDMNSVVKEIGSNITTPEDAQEKINTINSILQKSEGSKSIIGQHSNIHFSFKEKLFYISSIILGTLITISSFIWGILW